MAELNGTDKLHGIERNSPEGTFKYSDEGWKFKKRFEDYKKKHSSFYYEFYRDENGELVYRRHPNQG